jgi:hypothetical protein
MILNLDAKRLKDKIEFKNNAYYYKSNNRKVTERELGKVVRQEVERAVKKQEKIAIQLVVGKIDFETWQKKSIQIVKTTHVNMMRLGRGGTENTFAIHYLEVGNDLRKVHYPAHKQFAKDIKKGNLTIKQIVNRARQYGFAIKTTYERGRLSIETFKGVKQARRLLGACKNHCSDCISYAERGWVNLSDIILPGMACQCGQKCCCSVEYRNPTVSQQKK